MTRPATIAARLQEVLLDGHWVANTNYKENLAGITWQQATQQVGNLNTIAALTFHINYYLEGVLQVLTGGPLEIRDRYSFDMPPVCSGADWQALVNRLLGNAGKFVEQVAQLPDPRLDELFVEEKYGTWLRNFEGMIEHCYYHLGQVSLLKKLVSETRQKPEEIILETERLILKSVTPALIHYVFETASKEERMNALGIGEAEYERYKAMHEQGMETNRLSLFYFLVVNKETGRPMGECGFHTWNRAHNRAEIFYALKNDPDKRKGYLSEALPVVLDFGFNALNLQRIEALVADWNTPSVKLLLKNNFVKEGTLKAHYFTEGKYEDSDYYALIRASQEQVPAV